MPVMRCSKKKKKGLVRGWKFGVHGFCYISKGSKEKAKLQGRAIHAARRRRLKKKNK